MNPNVFGSLFRSSGPISSETVAKDGSEKYNVGDVLIAVLDLSFGLHAGRSSSTKIFFKIFPQSIDYNRSYPIKITNYYP